MTGASQTVVGADEGNQRPADPVDFAEVRAQFHHLVELDPAACAQALRLLASEQAGLAAAVADLLDQLDARDLEPPPVSVTPPQLGPFRVLQLLGRGGMGEVFLGERADGAFEQRVALKLIRGGLGGIGLDDHFRRERKILARLQHPHIARLLDGGLSANGSPWLAMEYVDGVDLAAWVTTRHPDLRQRIGLFIKICDAVAFAHRALIVHRDLKPANILVDGVDEPKLLDFGVAKLLDDENESSPRTLLPAMTLRYAAPEQVIGDRTTTVTDVYALGVLLFELITRSSPYVAAATGAMAWGEAIRHGVRQPLAVALGANSLLTSAEQQQAARQLSCVVDKALAKSPVDRYAGASLLADDLADWLATRPFRSGVGSVRQRFSLRLRRYRWLLLAVSATLLVLSLATVFALREAREARHQAAVASDNFEALLGVLSAANPMHYAGRDPAVSEFLLTAAAQIQRDHVNDPALQFRALGEIGHGLINLGKDVAAEHVLDAALAAAARDPSISTESLLGYLKLQVIANNCPDAATLTRVRATAIRIEALAARLPQASAAADALASVAGALARCGDFVAARRLFEISTRDLDHSGLPPHAQENILRQKGWAAMRAGDAELATHDLKRARQLVTASPDAFSPMRIAELDLLLAEAASDQRDVAAARASFQRAEAVMLAEFPVQHPERRSLLTIQAALHLTVGAYASALALLDEIDAGGFPVADGRSRIWLAALRSEALAGLGRCHAARQVLTDLPTADWNLPPRHQRRLAQAEELAERCH